MKTNWTNALPEPAQDDELEALRQRLAAVHPGRNVTIKRLRRKVEFVIAPAKKPPGRPVRWTAGINQRLCYDVLVLQRERHLSVAKATAELIRNDPRYRGDDKDMLIRKFYAAQRAVKAAGRRNIKDIDALLV